MARASYRASARALAHGAQPLAWLCAATWPVFTPPLTVKAEISMEIVKKNGSLPI
jgi:hypothetical protein